MPAESRPIVIDLFAGAGGLSLGFEQAGFDVAAAVEHDPVHAAVHEFNFPETATLCRDATTLSGAEILDCAGLREGSVHTVAGGPPCQGFSLMGKRDADDPRNGLVGEFARLVAEIQPRYFVMENVSGLLTSARGAHAEAFIEAVSGSGYRVVTPVRVLDASEYGVAQKRLRVFFLGHREDVPAPRYPYPVNAAGFLRPPPNPIMSDFGRCPTVHDTIGDLHDTQLPTESDRTVPGRSYRGQGEVFFGRRREWDAQSLSGCASTAHTQASELRFANTTPGTTEKVSRFHRLHPAGVSPTLRAGTGSDRGSHTAARPLHYLWPRVITVREAARLHGYPDHFGFHATKWQGFREVGNSVPPPLARAVAAELLRADGIVTREDDRAPLVGDESLRHVTARQSAAMFAARD